MESLSTWDIPINGILVADGLDYIFTNVKRERKPRIGTVHVQYFINGKGKNKKIICFMRGVPVIEKEGKYYIKSEVNE